MSASSQSVNDNNSGNKGKGKYTGKTTQKKRKEGEGGKLSIQFDQETWRAIGHNHGTWARDLGLLARTHIPIRCEVPFNKFDDKVKAPVYQGMLDRYHFTLTPAIKQAMDGQMASQLRNWRCDMHKYFKDIGGELNPEIAKSIPHKDIMNVDDWIWLCDYWSHQKQMELASQNKENRSKRDGYVSSHGSKSFSAHRADLVNPETNQYIGDIEFHRLMHTNHQSHTWCGPQAEKDYVEMVKVRDSQDQQASDVGSCQSQYVHLTEEEIVQSVRKTRSGYVKGKGKVIKGSSCSSVGPCDNSEIQELKAQVASYKDQLQTYATQLNYSMNFIQQLSERWNTQFPGSCPIFDVANMFHHPSSAAGTSHAQPTSSNTQQQNNDFIDCYRPSPPRDRSE